MTNYRRVYSPNGTYFFTINLNNRNSRLLTDNINLLREAFKKVKDQYSFTINAITVLPEHFHCVLTFQDINQNYSTIIRLIKSNFSRGISSNELTTPSRQGKKERGIWQRRFWAHLIISDEDYRRHIEYCYYNPVKHGYVTIVSDWPYSSFHRDVKSGLFPVDWGGESPLELVGDLNFGEVG